MAGRRTSLNAILLAIALATGIAVRGSASPESTLALQARPAARPILILISIDGWRWDYLARYQPRAIGALAARGVRSEGLIPVFPSKTFPNHYSIVTGLYPNRHGIVLNNIVDPALPGQFSLSNVSVQKDTRWWGGVPLWVTVEQQDQIAATMFWPGSDAEIAGHRPRYWRPYVHDAPNDGRVDQVLEWLRKPAAEQPTFVTLYFSEVDSAGHAVGPDSPRMRDAVLHVDAAIARLVAGLQAGGLIGRVNLVLVSDHGMAALDDDHVILLDDYIDMSTVTVVDWSPVLTIAPRQGSVDDLYRALKDKHPALEIYKRDDLPDQYRLRGHPRLQPIIGIANDGWLVTARTRPPRDREATVGGDHGYDPRHQSMHGLFIAAGPAFKQGITVPRFDNIHVYELLCRVLGVRPVLNDGDPGVTAGFFR